MKKTISVMLSVIMLFGIMTTAVFAVDGIDPWDLADFGQKSWTIKETSKAPVIDGRVEEGEYTVSETGLAVANKDSDGRFFVVDSPSDIVVDVHMSHDSDRFYLGVVIDGPALIREIAPNGTLDGRVIAMLGCDKNNFNKSKMYRVELNPEDVSADGVDEVVSTIVGNKLTYEFAVKKNAMLDQYGIDECDQLYIMLLIIDVTEESMENADLWNEFYFGFKSSDLKEIFPEGAPRYCHVVFLEEADPETEAPVTEAPETEAPAGETEAPATDAPAPDTNVTEVPGEGGCGATVAAMGIALVAALGTCTAFISKKR